jgi:C1A family cysteine protease
VAYGLKSYQERVERQWPVEQHTFSPAYIYNQIRKSADCSGGTSYSDALNLLRKEGVASLADFPYTADDCTRLPSALARQNAGSFRIADWRRVNVQDETEVKNHIVAGFPVLVGAIVDSSFQNLKGRQSIRNSSGPAWAAMRWSSVGYDDNRGAFKLINSWGPEWGDRGFGWVRYAAFRQMTREGYVAQDIVSPMPIPTPAPQPAPTPNRPNPTPNPPPPRCRHRRPYLSHQSWGSRSRTTSRCSIRQAWRPGRA